MEVAVELLLGFLFALVPIGLIIVLVVYISKTNDLIRKIHLLELEFPRLQRLEDELAGLKERLIFSGQVARPESRPATGRPPLPAESAAPPPVRATTPVRHPEPFAQQPVPAQAPQPSLALPKPAPSRTREEWEALIGGKLLNRIGALALIIGMGFFLKYAFDNNWITETMRVVIGVVIGAGLVLMASWAHRKGLEVFSQGLVGAGISVLYLSVYASFSYYHLVPQVVAFLLMSVVTILAFLQAFTYDSLAVSLLGLVGGFLTPFLLSTGEANEVGLFTYIALLDAGLLAVIVMKDKWALLEPIALASTYLVYVLWYKEYYAPDLVLPTVYFLIVFWGLFYGLALSRDLRSLKSFGDLRNVTGVANVLLLYMSLYSLIEPDHHAVMGAVTLGLGLVYFGTAMLVRTRSADSVDVYGRQVMTAIILLVIATAIQFTGFRTVQWWSVEALAIVYCGVRWNVRFAWVSGSVLFAVALVKILFIPESFSTSAVIEFGLLLNQRAVTLALFSSCAGIGALLLRKDVEPRRLLISLILDYTWPVVIFALLTAETAGYFKGLLHSSSGVVSESLEFKQLMTFPVVWITYSLILTASGIRWDVVAWKMVGSGVALVSVCFVVICGITYSPVQDFTLVANFRFSAMLLVLAGTIIHILWIRKEAYFGSWNTDVLGAVGVIIVLLMFDLITGETKDFFQKAKYIADQSAPGRSALELVRLENLEQLSLSAVWLVYSIALMAVGIWRRQREIRIASFALFGFTILKIFVYDLSFLDTLYRIFSFIGLGVILLAVSYVYQRYKEVVFGNGGAA